MNAERFDVLMGWLKADRDGLEKMLWDAQLRERPDSVRLTVSEAYRWMDESPNVDALVTWWNKECAESYLNTIERIAARGNYVVETVNNHRLHVARSLAMALQYPAFVIYECGRNADGTYRWRGIRYGVEGSQYLSGFGRF
jgi:hypothetical protein